MMKDTKMVTKVMMKKKKMQMIRMIIIIVTGRIMMMSIIIMILLMMILMMTTTLPFDRRIMVDPTVVVLLRILIPIPNLMVMVIPTMR